MKLFFCETKATREQFFGCITGITAKSEPQDFFQNSKSVFFEILKKTSSKKGKHFFNEKTFFNISCELVRFES